jgi:hypothetical protein
LRQRRHVSCVKYRRRGGVTLCGVCEFSTEWKQFSGHGIGSALWSTPNEHTTDNSWRASEQRTTTSSVTGGASHDLALFGLKWGLPLKKGCTNCDGYTWITTPTSSSCAKSGERLMTPSRRGGLGRSRSGISCRSFSKTSSLGVTCQRCNLVSAATELTCRITDPEKKCQSRFVLTGVRLQPEVESVY